MSIIVLKRKSATQNPKYNTVNKWGFSLQGTHRNIGVVNPTNLANTTTNTKFKGVLPKGNGGCCGTYDVNISKGKCCVPQYTIKPSNVSMKTALINNNRWINSAYPRTSFKNLTQDDQGIYIYKKQVTNICDSSTYYAKNNTVCSEPGCVGSYTKGPFYSTSSETYTKNNVIPQRVCLPFANRDLVVKCGITSISESEEESDADTEEEADADTEEEADADTEEEADADTEEDADADTEEDADADTEEDADADTEEDADADTEEDTTTYVDIYVSSGVLTSDPYTFYTDSDGTELLSDNTLNLNTSYKFQRLDSTTSHPFYISDNGYEEEASSDITLVGDGSATQGISGTESFTLTFNGLTTSDTLTYYCTSHSVMQNVFTLES